MMKISFRYMLESASLELFFKYVELPNFDIASDALATFKVSSSSDDSSLPLWFSSSKCKCFVGFAYQKSN